jgi:hypothetical protein
MRVANIGKLLLILLLFVPLVSGCAERQSSENDDRKTSSDNHDSNTHSVKDD